MKKLSALISGLAIGATLMYIFDPEKGAGRRADIKRKAGDFRDDATQALEGQVKNLGKRTGDLVSGARSSFRERFGKTESTAGEQIERPEPEAMNHV